MQKPNGSFVKRVFAAGLAGTTALWTVASFLTLPALAVEAHPAGTLVVSSGTVWHISDDGTMRHGIDSLAKFYSNRYNFANVVPANSADLALPDGGLLALGSGALINDAGTIYQVSGGVKHGFTSAANYTGNGFSFASAKSASLSGVTAGAAIDNTSGAHLEGTFVVSAGTVWKITATGRKGVPSAGVLYSHGAGFGDVVTANAADLALASEGNATFRTGALVNDGGTVYAVTSTAKRGFPTGSCFTGFGFTFSMLVTGSASGLTAGANYCADTTTPTPPTTPPTSSSGALSVSLASDTPAAATVVKNAARVGFTKVNFAATGGDVTIDSLTAERKGISLDSNFTDVILLDVSNNTSLALAKQIGNEKSLGSTHQAVFNDDIVVKNGTTVSLMLSGNMASTVQAADQVQLALVNVALLGSATMSGTLPITGNIMTMNNNVTISSVTVAAGGSNPAASTQNVGVTDYIVSAIKLTVTSQEDVEVSRIRFYQNGTAADGDINNVKLWADGSVVAGPATVSNKSVEFNLTNPIKILKGNNKEFNLSANIVDGSARTISLDIDKKVDVVVKGKTYDFFIVPSYPNSTSPFFNASDTTINKGGITFSKGVLSSLNVSAGTNGQPIGALKVTVQGEPVQVTQMAFGLNYTSGIGGTTATTTNIVLKDPTGKIVAGPVSPGAANAINVYSATSTDTVIFPVGTNTYLIYGDIASGADSGGTIAVRIVDPDSLATSKGTVTNQTITASPTTDLTLDTVTIKAGQISVSTSLAPAAQSVIIGASGFTFASFILDASNSGEDVRVTQINVAVHSSNNSIQNDVANLTLYDGATALSPIVQPTAVAATTATSTFSLTSPIVVAKGTNKTLTLKGDLVTGTSTHTLAYGCNSSGCISATGASTASSVTATVTNSDGQTMTLSTSGTLTIAGDASEPTTGALVVGGASKVTIGTLLLSASQEDVNLSEIQFGATAVNSGALNDEFTMVYLFDGATQVASMAPTTTNAFTFAGLDGKFTVPKGSAGKKLTVKVDSAEITNNNGDGNTGDSGQGINLSLAEDAYNGKGVSSGVKLGGTATSGAFTGQQYSVFKTVPSWQAVALSTNTLSDGVRPLYKFKVTADAKGDLGFYKASFAISTTTATVTQFQLFEEPGTTNEVNLTNNAARAVGPSPDLVASSDGKGGQYRIYILFDTGTAGVTNGGLFRFVGAGASKTFELRGSVANSVTGSSVSVSMMGDNAFQSTYPSCAGANAAMTGNNTCGTGIAAQEQGKFVWSDLAYGNNTSTATDTLEWTNGYRVTGLTTTATPVIVNR